MNGRDRNTAVILALQHTDRISQKKREGLLGLVPEPSALLSREFEREVRNITGEAVEEFFALAADADRLFDRAEKAGVSWITCLDEEFPAQLREISPMPTLLFVKGNVGALGGFGIAVVGTRKPTRYGLKLADMFSRELARAGLTVISGFARGIDTAAHKACIESGAPTVAVFGCGADVCYPAENRALYEQIAESGGAVVSEYPPGFKPLQYRFPERNRIISGLARGVFIPEAAKRSGSLITAEFALEQGRDVFVAPGNVFAEESGGTNQLLRTMPHALVLSPEDILEHYRMTPKERVEKGQTEQMTVEENLVIAVLRRGEAHFEELLAETGLATSALTDVLVGLELSGIAEQTNGNYYSLC